MTTQRPDEKTCDYLGRFAIDLADAALKARERNDDVHALFFAVKAAEVLKLARVIAMGDLSGLIRSKESGG